MTTASRPRRRLAPLLLLTAAALLLWGVFSWPLPRHFATAIPATHRRDGLGGVVLTLTPGDHLQLLYHFWLTREKIAGRVPPFANIYEFNTGDDRALAAPDPGYVPFSLLYAGATLLASDAAAWNFSLLCSFLLGVGGVFVLARRYTRRRLPAALAALAANALPYRWITLLGGSPTGFAMGLTPWLLAGLDAAVRDRRAAGGRLAGVALLAAYGSDLHVFYFGALAAPCWCVFARLADPAPLRPSAARLRATLRALLPALALAAVAAALALLTSRHLARTDMAAGRGWTDVKRFSPTGHGFYTWRPLGLTSNHIFLGLPLAALLGLGLAGRLRAAWSDRAAGRPPAAIAREWLPVVLAGAAIWLLGVLAMGANGPFDGLAFRAARRLIPKFAMIRQPVKVFCLMPPLLAVAAALLFDGRHHSPAPAAAGGGRGRSAMNAAAAVLLAVVLAEYRLQLRPGLCRLPPRMAVYEAAALDARQANRRAHAVALPLWPGDSHYSSVYEYGITRSRLRLVNGYAPAVPEGYHTNVFKRLESLNQGVLDESQAAFLRAMGVGHVIFHEQPYPERISPFPAAVALQRLLRHPLLEPLARDGQMWGFRLRGTPRPAGELPPPRRPPLHAASCHWSFPPPENDGTAPPAVYPLRLRSPAAPAPRMRYLLRLTGAGALVSESGARIESGGEARWLEAPFTPPLGDVWRATEGAPRLLHALLTAGDGAGAPDADGVHRWPAAAFFHVGATDPADGAVLLDPLRDPCCLALHGPDLPLPPGRWQARLLSAPADDGATEEIGRLIPAVIGAGGRHLHNVGVVAGTPAVCDFDYDGALPLRLEFHYHGRRPARITALEMAPAGTATTP